MKRSIFFFFVVSGSPSPRAGASAPVGASTFTTYVEETPKLCGFLLKQSDSSAASIAASKAASAAATIGYSRDQPIH